MVRSFFRKWMGTETMRDRLKPFLKALESRYSSNEDTVRIMLSDGWKKKRHRIVDGHFNGDKDKMRNPTDEDFEKVVKVDLFSVFYCTKAFLPYLKASEQAYVGNTSSFAGIAGYPGESAFNCVIPGITSLIEKGFVDEENIGVQGHSLSLIHI